MERVRALIRRVGGHTASVNYRYLELAVEAELRTRYLRHSLTSQVKRLYQIISEEQGVRADRISRGVARAVADLWDHGDREELEKAVGHRLLEKPYPNELIFDLAAHLDEKRSVGA